MQVVDAQDMSCFANASFDVVTSAFGIFMIPDPKKALQEINRVLKPGGHFGFTVWGPVERMHFQRFIFQICQEMFPSNAPTAPPPTDLPKWTDKQMPLNALHEAGFCQVHALTPSAALHDSFWSRSFHLLDHPNPYRMFGSRMGKVCAEA